MTELREANRATRLARGIRPLRHLLVLLLIALFPCVASADDSRPLKVVTSLSTFKALVDAIGGDRVETVSVASPQFNPHYIEPRPSDVLRLKRSDLFVHGGLDLEVWRGPLVDAAGNMRARPGGDRELDLSHNIELLNMPAAGTTRAQGDIHVFGNPHYWISPVNALTMAKAIRGKLEEIDPGSVDYYRTRHENFVRTLEGKIGEWTERVKTINGAPVVAYHDEWPYFARFVGVNVVDFVEPKPGIPPTPRHVEQLAEKMRQNGVKLIIQSTFFPDSTTRELAERTGARVEKLCQGVGELPECSDFVAMIDHNIGRLFSGLGDSRTGNVNQGKAP